MNLTQEQRDALLKDCTQDIFTNNSPEVVVTITHRPTGVRVSGKGIGRYKLREKLCDELAALLEKQA